MKVDLSNSIAVRLIDDTGGVIRQLDFKIYQHSVDVFDYRGVIVNGRIISYPSQGATALADLWESYCQEMGKVLASDSLFDFLEGLAEDVARTWNMTEGK